ncbi:MAG: hypothetical protein HQ515_05475 [Phycisphaeraceae bacterium]|nr:hypothetical protein [Phycisphaeraceae bacterium]
MARKLEVIKTDGSFEMYLHTKVLGTLCNAFGLTEQSDLFLAQELAEVVTYYLYHDKERIPRQVSSSEILSIIKVVLTTTGHDNVAEALSEHHYERLLRRNRTEVACTPIDTLVDAQHLCENDPSAFRDKWSKAQIVHDLIKDHHLARQVARAVAGMVEEKVLRIGLTVVPSDLIRLLTLNDTALVLRAQECFMPQEQPVIASETADIMT